MKLKGVHCLIQPEAVDQESLKPFWKLKPRMVAEFSDKAEEILIKRVTNVQKLNVIKSR